jgi:2-polyprenyl-6-hydroxyphenyl methylase/3-demethylubiquinone-9 3-methyltransferase
MNIGDDITGYEWKNAEHTEAHDFLLPTVGKLIRQLEQKNVERRVLDLGCGNGSVANWLSSREWDVVGVDPSLEGISQANFRYPHLLLEQGSAYDDLEKKYGRFPLVISLEVVEHVYSPRKYAKTLFSLLEAGGRAIISTPYHGYWKNLALAISGKMDSHFTALWDHGHIKFWSFETIKVLLNEQGFTDIKFFRVGRVPPLAKSMIVVAVRSS